MTIKRRINPWFDHEDHQLNPKEEQHRKLLRNKTQTNKNTKKSIRHTRSTSKITKWTHKGKTFRSKDDHYKAML